MCWLKVKKNERWRLSTLVQPTCVISGVAESGQRMKTARINHIIGKEKQSADEHI